MGIDATRKNNPSEMGTRMWMPDIAMDQATIDTVSKKWDEYGIR
jgi:3-polyprenyl-4-hydroxybenzoate decarboxylase